MSPLTGQPKFGTIRERVRAGGREGDKIREGVSAGGREGGRTGERESDNFRKNERA